MSLSRGKGVEVKVPQEGSDVQRAQPQALWSAIALFGPRVLPDQLV